MITAEKSKMFGKNFIAGILSVSSGGLLLAVGTKSQNPYCRLVFLLLVVFGLLLVGTSLIKKNDQAADWIRIRELVLLVLLFVNPLFGKTLGFYITAFLEISLISLLIAKERTAKSVLKILLFSLVMAIVGYLIFSILLKIHCPRGAFSLV
jgi:Tripartite tricarboxylate transporter TctB family.